MCPGGRDDLPAERDVVLPHPRFAEAVRQGLPAVQGYRVVQRAGRFDFLVPCSVAPPNTASLLVNRCCAALSMRVIAPALMPLAVTLAWLPDSTSMPPLSVGSGFLGTRLSFALPVVGVNYLGRSLQATGTPSRQA